MRKLFEAKQVDVNNKTLEQFINWYQGERTSNYEDFISTISVVDKYGNEIEDNEIVKLAKVIKSNKKNLIKDLVFNYTNDEFDFTIGGYKLSGDMMSPIFSK